eukprot:3312085-Rhodomonas_salina.1
MKSIRPHMRETRGQERGRRLVGRKARGGGEGGGGLRRGGSSEGPDLHFKGRARPRMLLPSTHPNPHFPQSPVSDARLEAARRHAGGFASVTVCVCVCVCVCVRVCM